MKCLVIVINRCQPAYLGCYGNDWLATPTLDALAAESVVFDRHFTGDATPAGVRREWLGAFGSDRLADLFWNRDITTARVVDERSYPFGSTYFDGFETQTCVRRHALPELEQDSLLGGTVQTAIEWLQQCVRRDQWLLWLELGALQPPWAAAEYDVEALEGLEEANLEPWFDAPTGAIDAVHRKRIPATYAGVVSGVDQWLGQLFDFLHGAGLYDDLAVIVTSDCGLPLGEHGVFGDAEPHLFEERVRVPLILHLPGHAEAGRRVHQLSQHVDLLPTLADLFSLSLPEERQRKSLLPVARGQTGRHREYSCSHLPGREAAIRTDQWYLILPATGEPLLYVKPEDRWEVNNVAKQHPDVAEHLELTLRRYRMMPDRAGDLPELRQDVLRIAQR